jgi:hypothetical protein
VWPSALRTAYWKQILIISPLPERSVSGTFERFFCTDNGGVTTVMDATDFRPVRRSEMSYLGVCLTCEEEKIRGMLARARPISYSAARRSIGPAVLDTWATTVESTFGAYWRGLQVKRNRALGFLSEPL